MLLIDLIMFCEIFDRMFEISCVGVGNVNCTFVFFHFEMCHTWCKYLFTLHLPT